MANSPRLAELADLITRREYNYAMCKARKHEEDLVRRYAMDHNIEYTTLADTIEELYQEGIISDASRENLHGIRIIGNKAVHQDDNDANDAKSAYDMLKRELTTYSDQKFTNPVRTPVAYNKNQEPDYGMRRRVREREEDRDETGEIDMSYGGNGRRGGGSQYRDRDRDRDRGGRRPAKSEGGALYTILKILIPVLIVVLLIILIKSMFPKKTVEPETTTAEITTEAEVITTEALTTEAPTTEAPTTEAPTTEAPKSYQTKGEGVRLRYASDPKQIYTTVNNGTFIGPVTDYENTTGDSTYDGFVQFTYDGKNLIVKKDFIEQTDSNG